MPTKHVYIDAKIYTLVLLVTFLQLLNLPSYLGFILLPHLVPWIYFYVLQHSSKITKAWYSLNCHQLSQC